MMSDPRTRALLTGDDLLRLAIPPMTPQSDRRALMTTSRPGHTRQQQGAVRTDADTWCGRDAREQPRETEGDRVYERG